MVDPGHDLWRRRIEALNDGRPQEPFASALPGRAAQAAGRRRALFRLMAGLGAMCLMLTIVLGSLAVFPLAREGKIGPCAALRGLLVRQSLEPGRVPLSSPPAVNMDLPAWLRCYVGYWRRLDVPSVKTDGLGRMVRSMDPSLGLYLAGAGGAVAVAAFVLWRRRPNGRRDEVQDAFRALGMDPAAVARRVAPPPVDLSRPIAGDAAWRAIRSYAADPAYRRAVETVRLRYQLVGNQMLLPNTLREVMERGGRDFREAMLRIAEDDGVGRRG